MEPLEGAISKAQDFLAAWKTGDWQAMLDCCQKTWIAKGDEADRIQALRNLFGGYILVHGKELERLGSPVISIRGGKANGEFIRHDEGR